MNEQPSTPINEPLAPPQPPTQTETPPPIPTPTPEETPPTIEPTKKNKKPLIIAIIIIVVLIIVGAIVAFLLLGQPKDEVITNNNNNSSQTNTSALYKVGDSVTLSDYSWQVLDVKTLNKGTDEEQVKALLISKYIIDVREFDNDGGSWADSSLRQLLNGEFWDTFAVTDQERVINTNDDMVFVLSRAEVKKYFKENSDRVAVLNVSETKLNEIADRTTTTLETLREQNGNKDGFQWWLRDDSTEDDGGLIVMPDGEFWTYANDKTFFYGVRPALWLDITPKESSTNEVTGVNFTLAKTNYARGEQLLLDIKITGSAKDTTAWVGIIPADIAHGDEALADEHDTSYIYLHDWGNTNTKFWAPTEPGKYTIRAFASDGGGAELASIDFTVY